MINSKTNSICLFSVIVGCSSVNAQISTRIGEAEDVSERPNVLLIASDDLCDALNCFGNPNVHTPNIDRLAEMGVLFNQAYNQSPLSGPSRASIMTGYRPDRTGVHDLAGRFRNAIPDAVTLPELFKNNGYYTCRIGKIYHAGVPSDIGQPGADDPQSWSVTYNPIGRDRTDEYLLKGNTTLGTWLNLDCNDNEMTDGISANVAISLLRGRYSNVGSAYGGPARTNVQSRRSAQPFFMAVGFYRPHIPYIAPQQYFDMYDINDIVVPENFEEEWLNKPEMARNNLWNAGASDEECKESILAYYASVSFIDAQIGKLIDALEELNLMDNTIIVFWSDHGYMLGEHGLWQKQNLFENTAQQPLLFYAPGYSSGVPCNEIVEMIDIYPTIAELAGLQPPSDIDGKSLVELLKNPRTDWNYPAFTQTARTLVSQGNNPYSSMNGSAVFTFNPSLNDRNTTIFGRSVRVDRYRYTEWEDGKRGCELYDYEVDPDEHINFANDKNYQKIKEELSIILHSSYDQAEIDKTNETIKRNQNKIVTASSNTEIQTLITHIQEYF